MLPFQNFNQGLQEVNLSVPSNREGVLSLQERRGFGPHESPNTSPHHLTPHICQRDHGVGAGRTQAKPTCLDFNFRMNQQNWYQRLRFQRRQLFCVLNKSAQTLTKTSFLEANTKIACIARLSAPGPELCLHSYFQTANSPEESAQNVMTKPWRRQ